MNWHQANFSSPQAEALQELVASWHSLTPSVRAAIIDLIP
jgi:hypothetical protein